MVFGFDRQKRRQKLPLRAENTKQTSVTQCIPGWANACVRALAVLGRRVGKRFRLRASVGLHPKALERRICLCLRSRR